jgi:hypothetical protein
LTKTGKIVNLISFKTIIHNGSMGGGLTASACAFRKGREKEIDAQ